MLSYCNYYQNQAEVTSSSLVTLAISLYFQTLCFLPFFKAQQGFETYLNKYLPINFPYYSNLFTTNLPLKCGHLVVTKKFNGYKLNTRNPLDIIGVYAHIIIINANIGEWRWHQHKQLKRSILLLSRSFLKQKRTKLRSLRKPMR